MTPYEKWIDGGLTGLGSFQTALFKAYLHADGINSKKLQKAFPEWFTENTSEFNYKTARQWMEELPEPYRSQALKYARGDEYPRLSNVTSALSEAFAWSETEEGYDYWSNLYNTL